MTSRQKRKASKLNQIRLHTAIFAIACIALGIAVGRASESSALKQVPGQPTDQEWEAYVDRYPRSLKYVYETFIQGTGQSKASFGKMHYTKIGAREGRIQRILTGKEDIADYGAYVEYYGDDLLQKYRSSNSEKNPANRATIFEWGKWHWFNAGRAEGRDTGGGIDWNILILFENTIKQYFESSRDQLKMVSPFKWANAHKERLLNLLGQKLIIGDNNGNILEGAIVFALDGDDSIFGTQDADILHGGFGNDIIKGHSMSDPGISAQVVQNSGKAIFFDALIDHIYGGPGSDLFVLDKGTTLHVMDFRKSADAIALGKYSKEHVVLKQGLAYGLPSTEIIDSTSNRILAVIVGSRPDSFGYALKFGAHRNVLF